MTQTSDRVENVSAEEAFRLLQGGDAVLVDVRTRAEWVYVGVPDLSPVSGEPIFLEWQQFPSMAVDPAFPATLAGKLAERGVPMERPILFLCRSGVRSRAAALAMTEIGYPRCLNVAGGFEGPQDEHRRRGRRDGWKAKGLPWVQS